MSDGSAAWRNELPRLARYCDRLPDAFDSYSTCRASAQLLVPFRARKAIDRFDGLPTPLDALLRESADGWIPEVAYQGMLLALRDRFFGDDEDGYFDWLTEIQRSRFDGGVMPLPPTPVDIAHAGIAFWAKFHRGTFARLVTESPGTYVTRLEHPSPLIADVMFEFVARSMAIALVRTDAPNPTVTFRTIPDSSRADWVATEFTARWKQPG